jgi:hypothetical protein
MKRAKAFPYVFFHSLTSLSYYKEILRTKRSFSIKYFLGLATLSSLIIALNLSVRVTPVVRDAINTVLTQLEAMYPNDLVIRSENNAWEINKNEPYIIPFAQMEEAVQENLPQNFIVFYKEGTIEDLQKYNTFMLVNAKNVIVQNTNKIESYPISDVPDGEFNKQTLLGAIENVRKVIGPIEIGIIVIMSFFVILYNFVFRAFYLLFVGAFIWVLSMISGAGHTFKQSYRISLHAMTLPIVIELMLTTANANFNMPFWFMLLNMTFAAVVVLGISKEKTHTPTKKQPPSDLIKFTQRPNQWCE